jgi:predicted transporter
MRAVLIGVAIAAIIFAATGGHILFFPLLLIPLGVFSLRRWQRHRA